MSVDKLPFGGHGRLCHLPAARISGAPLTCLAVVHLQIPSKAGVAQIIFAGIQKQRATNSMPGR